MSESSTEQTDTPVELNVTSGNAAQPGSPAHGQEDDSLDVAIAGLRQRDPELAATLTRLFTAVALEASRGPRFANSLSKALRGPASPSSSARTRRPQNRRNPGPFDPFVSYANGGEIHLRTLLGALDLEALRDIVAEHGMDTDRLAMKWKDPDRVIERIVERVVDRSTKGAAFRD
ncbi:hypothetical protein [Kribbella sp. NPDC051770]|uniref:hypothetical protein n=1 Tax=Kribbella sp. NPDC051770 TaxID=3155413 RepID=UPI003415C209